MKWRSKAMGTLLPSSDLAGPSLTPNYPIDVSSVAICELSSERDNASDGWLNHTGAIQHMVRFGQAESPVGIPLPVLMVGLVLQLLCDQGWGEEGRRIRGRLEAML